MCATIMCSVYLSKTQTKGVCVFEHYRCTISHTSIPFIYFYVDAVHSFRIDPMFQLIMHTNIKDPEKHYVRVRLNCLNAILLVKRHYSPESTAFLRGQRFRREFRDGTKPLHYFHFFIEKLGGTCRRDPVRRL